MAQFINGYAGSVIYAAVEPRIVYSIIILSRLLH